jgi:GMP synthase-like glutamine amidotransferase
MRLLCINHHSGPGKSGILQKFSRVAKAELHEHYFSQEPLKGATAKAYDGVIVLGGAMNVHQEEEYPWLREEKSFLQELLAMDKPVLGVCLGGQLLAEVTGGSVFEMIRPRVGWYPLHGEAAGTTDPLFHHLVGRFCGFEWHKYEFIPPPSASILTIGHRQDIPQGEKAHPDFIKATQRLEPNRPIVQAFRYNRAWGVQFHIEVTEAIIQRWVSQTPEMISGAGRNEQALWKEVQDRLAGWQLISENIFQGFLRQL